MLPKRRLQTTFHPSKREEKLGRTSVFRMLWAGRSWKSS